VVSAGAKKKSRAASLCYELARLTARKNNTLCLKNGFVVRLDVDVWRTGECQYVAADHLQGPEA
jgi:hypothetical protein